MAPLQPSVSVPPSITASLSPIGGGVGGAVGGAAVTQGGNDLASVEQLVLDLCDPLLRENALVELSKKREMFQDILAPLLWHSFGTIASLLQEILSIYDALATLTLSPGASNRVCNVLALFQDGTNWFCIEGCGDIGLWCSILFCRLTYSDDEAAEDEVEGLHSCFVECVASHPETRTLFLNANIPCYLYPFLNTESKTRPFEYLRLTSLGVIGALVKVDDSKVISFLLETEIVPRCLRCMEVGSELSKTVATFIVQKILLDNLGLCYICAKPERLFAVGSLLVHMVLSHPVQPSAPARLFKHIIRCFHRLSDNPSACVTLQALLPDVLKDGTVDSFLVDDPSTRRCLQQLLHKVTVGTVGGAPRPGLDHMSSRI